MLLAREQAEIILALTIDYGQKARDNEIDASAAICTVYGIEHKVITLPFMSEMKSGIIKNSGIEDSLPWVPNRNGLFINLAACYAENLDAGWIICGFNREEGIDFPDNSAAYVEAVNEGLSYSTLNKVKLKSFVLDMDKVEIIQAASGLKIDFKSLWSCYRPGDKPCGQCPSCIRNDEAYKKAGIEI
jgi:7-cyano-7-deazaguanine synthase